MKNNADYRLSFLWEEGMDMTFFFPAERSRNRCPGLQWHSPGSGYCHLKDDKSSLRLLYCHCQQEADRSIRKRKRGKRKKEGGELREEKGGEGRCCSLFRMKTKDRQTKFLMSHERKPFDRF